MAASSSGTADRLSDKEKHEAVGRALSRLDPDTWQNMLAIATQGEITVTLTGGEELTLSRADHPDVFQIKEAVRKLKEADFHQLPLWSGKRYDVQLASGTDILDLSNDAPSEMLPNDINAFIVEEEDEEEEEDMGFSLFD
eukprot:TRINITY_DN36165_c0_g1_i1.p1 TRINITY_DN36165_c0_g1~~TRINITY_DN36165_c0_g1_i1.p1  ORF type:complete len:140 (+),score=27.39 TRINITY_DN36165_c0_g1_i1:129-548(+)